MKYQAIVVFVFLGCLILAFLPLMMVESEPGMQYYQAECVDFEGHKVCKTDEQLIYFNFTGKDNLPESKIDSLANEL